MTLRSSLWMGVAGVALAGVLTGCGSSGSKSSSPTTSPPTTTSTSTSTTTTSTSTSTTTTTSSGSGAAPVGVNSTGLLTWGEPKGGGKHATHQPTLPVHSSPTHVGGVPGTVVQIATSNSDSYALTSTGTVWAWGANEQGELGIGSRSKGTSTTAVEVKFPAGVKIASLPNPTPFDGGLAIDTGGHLWGWGNDRKHQFCNSGVSPEATPVEFPVSGVSLAAGALTHVVFDAGGKVMTCGADKWGVRGNGRMQDGVAPTAVTGLPAGAVKAVTASWGNAGVLLADGAFYDWGYDHQGQLGDGRTVPSASPVRVALPAAATQVSEGGSTAKNGQTLALLSDDEVWVWGDGHDGQIGNGATADATKPVQVKLPAGVRFYRVNSGGASCYGITPSGDLWSWGWNESGQLGTGTSALTQLTPANVKVTMSQVSSTASNVAGLAATT